MASTVSIAASLWWLGAPSMVSAQQREKLWVGVGVGAGSLGSSSRGDQGDREAVAVAYINFGGWVNPQWQLGFDFGGIDVGDVRDLDGSVTAEFGSMTVAYYPRRTSGFHIKGGVSGSWRTIGIVDEFGTTARADLGTDVGFVAATGWDLNLGRRLWLTPALSFRYTRPGDLVLAGRTRVPDWTYKMVDVTIGVRFD